MLAERQASTGDTRTYGSASAGTDPSLASTRASATGTGSFGTRSSRKKRGLLRRSGIAVPAAGLALLLVVVVWGAAKVMNPRGTGASSLFQAIDGLGNSGSVALLEQERQTLMEMTAAGKTLSVASKPAMTDPEQILEAQNSNTSSSSQTTGGTGVATTAPPSDPTAAQATAKAMLASFGFSETTQWPCLYDIWEQESTWNVYASNPVSGAYGIPQALPADKMASVGADWQTDATTQIKWGLGYIKSVYGTPCAAWQNEVDYGYY
ncbi:MAG TPA: lytic transglycosylase domain-containing protein [Trebonia sp.]|jgi:hypothetical protein|nr:lytic transglycosylase domain-containing protein [Trebonia sp.]